MERTSRVRMILLAAGLGVVACLAAWIGLERTGTSSGKPISPPDSLPHDRNLAVIPPGATLDKTVRLAARVVPSARQLAWQEREFIAFVHFGVNTFTDREWGDGREDPALFNPTDFDARQWARVFRQAGMKLVILTAKHHDGFCLWPSRQTGHSVRRSPWRGGRGDVVREVAAACRAEGLRFGIYLSPWDRHEPTYGDGPAYNRFYRAQLRELLTGYRPVDEVWFDGACGEGPNGKTQAYDWPSCYRVVRELQPQAAISGMAPDVRWVGTETGVGRETEWSVLPLAPTGLPASFPGNAPNPLDDVFAPRDVTEPDPGERDRLADVPLLAWYPAEADVSIRPGWFYHPAEDHVVKTPEELVEIYFNSVGRNSVLLLNVPPDRRGRIADADIRNLLGMRAILDATFRTDLAAGSRISASNEAVGHESAAVARSKAGKYWTTPEGVETAWLELSLPHSISFDCVLLQEAIRTGQRVEQFRLEAWKDSEWEVFARGTTIGYKRLLRFDPVQTQRVRLVIEQSRSNPAIARLGLFKRP